jgi:hypothetical protein
MNCTNIIEALVPELRPHWFADERLLHHPLVVASVSNCEDASRANGLYQRKKQCLRDLKVNLGDGQEYVFLHERPYRFDALNRIVRHLSPADYWRLVGAVWIDSENIRQHFAGWQRLWSAPTVLKHECMTSEERAVLEAMSSSFPIWRGLGFRGRVRGLSWTLDRDKAIWFAQRYGSPGSGKLIHAEVEWHNVHAFFQGRRESEIIASYVEVLKIETLKGSNRSMA